MNIKEDNTVVMLGDFVINLIENVQVSYVDSRPTQPWMVVDWTGFTGSSNMGFFETREEAEIARKHLIGRFIYAGIKKFTEEIDND